MRFFENQSHIRLSTSYLISEDRWDYGLVSFLLFFFPSLINVKCKAYFRSICSDSHRNPYLSHQYCLHRCKHSLEVHRQVQKRKRCWEEVRCRRRSKIIAEEYIRSGMTMYCYDVSSGEQTLLILNISISSLFAPRFSEVSSLRVSVFKTIFVSRVNLCKVSSLISLLLPRFTCFISSTWKVYL